MARDTQRKPFSVFRSDAIDENERILAAGRQQRQENREKKEKGEATPSAAPVPSSDALVTAPQTVSTTTPAGTSATTTTTPTAETSETTTSVTNQPTTTSFSNDVAMGMHKSKSKKTENGITIYVPMKYYERIALMKMRTGVPIKDLALQAVIEFLDRNKTR